MKIGVVGVGGVGGYFGGLLARMGVDIHFVARGKHLRALQDEGLQVLSSQGNFHILLHATAEPHEIGPVDLVLFCVKSFDTFHAAREMESMVDDSTVILSLQNGIDNIEKLIAHYGPERIMGGTAYIESSLAAPGVIAHTGTMGRIVFGELDGGSSERALKILQVFQQAGIDTELSNNIERVLWEKFLFICGVHGVSTLSRAPLGLVLSCPETRELLVEVMGEVQQLAQRKGIVLAKSAVRDAMDLIGTYKKQFKCSMLRDLEWRRPMEIEALNGMVVKLGQILGLATPFNQTIYACIKLENQKILEPFWLSQLES
jgi:2-dehydropantoate 2-reductase